MFNIIKKIILNEKNNIKKENIIKDIFNFEIKKILLNSKNAIIDQYRLIGIDSSFKENIGLLVYIEFLYNKNNFTQNIFEDLINLNNDLSFNKESFMLKKEVELSIELIKKYQNDDLQTIIILDGSIINSEIKKYIDLDLKNISVLTYTSNPAHNELCNIFCIKNNKDINILNNKLNNFERTEWIESIYNKNIYFSYLKTKLEIVRIEKINNNIDDKIIEFILLNQIKKGFEYPLILQYVHFKTQNINNYFKIKNMFSSKNFKIKNIYKK